MTPTQASGAPSPSVHAREPANGGRTPTIREDGGLARENTKADAGLRSLDHYKRALPRWRYDIRQKVLPLVRWETPHLAWMQAKLRRPALDSYFAITANLGTHTFFMIFLPIMFWCGFAGFGQGLVHILAAGVFFTGFVKDLLSLPRPLSPPLQRITMSGYVSLEYGFPSTHSANAVSVVVYSILILRSPDNNLSPTMKLGLEIVACLYAVSIIFGRLYCGMHGFLDVAIGSLMGAAISLIEFYYGPTIEQFLLSQEVYAMLVLALIIIVLVRVHPEPADDCPCFDDSVAFAGTVIGVELGAWHYGRSAHNTVPIDFGALGLPMVALRILLGVSTIFAWREVAKPTLLKCLPHLFRVIETLGLDLPRRFHMRASEYQHVPLQLRVDNIMPSVSDLPNFVNNIRKGGRGRSVSVGPQSAADAYEALAYRERRRRESTESNNAGGPREETRLKTVKNSSSMEYENAGASSSAVNCVSGISWGKVSEPERIMGESAILSSNSPGYESVGKGSGTPLVDGQQDELGEMEMFAQVAKPRVRYDVEVVTKLVVYTGVGLLAAAGAPMMLEAIFASGV